MARRPAADAEVAVTAATPTVAVPALPPDATAPDAGVWLAELAARMGSAPLASAARWLRAKKGRPRKDRAPYFADVQELVERGRTVDNAALIVAAEARQRDPSLRNVKLDSMGTMIAKAYRQQVVRTDETK
jgi:hypothetical protein